MRIIITIFFLMIANFSTAQVNAINGKLTAVKNNFAIQYPKVWTIDSTGLMGTALVLFAPLESDTDQFRENVNVMVQDLSGQGIDIEKYKQITEKQISDFVNDGKQLESDIVKSKTGIHYKVHYHMTQGKFLLDVTSYCYIKDHKAHLVTFTCEVDKYEKYKIDAMEILDSFLQGM